MNTQKNLQGFTLLETLLVLAIVSGMILLGVNFITRQTAQQRLDRTALQAQQILTAGMAYYTSTGAWPGTCSFNSTVTNNSTAWNTLSVLQTAGYLPTSITSNAYGYAYKTNCDSVTASVYYVNLRVTNNSMALVIAGELPVAYVSDAFGNPLSTGTYVTAQVTIPGQNLNNARSVNFSGIYHHGACVPVPSCPGYNPATNACNTGVNCMTPQIMVSPVSVSGTNDANSLNVYPISSFTAYATALGAPPMSCTIGPTPPATVGPTPTATACPAAGIASPSGVNWRVCLQVITSKGEVSGMNTATSGTYAPWGQYGTMMVITRCTPPNEPYGSDFTVYTR
jgi:prepilin-type N-terminal cleavage/methylation domain-containing protein